MKESTDQCFVICPIGAEDSEIRKRSDMVLKHVIMPVLRENNFDAVRADQIPQVGMITTQIINHIVESPLVIADLTGSNPNVFYELAIRHAIRKPYIQLVSKGEQIPFDISGIRTIEVDISNLDSVERSKKQIHNQIQTFRKGHIPDSSISVAFTAKLLRDDRDLAEEIASRLGYYVNPANIVEEISERLSFIESSYYFDSGDSEKIDKIYRRLWSLNEYSLVSLEDLNSKLDEVLNMLSKSQIKDGS